MDISIVILKYKSKCLALNCIKSIKESDWGDLSYEIIVVDNNSNDEIGKILAWQEPEVKFLQNNRKSGMGKGNNRGIKEAGGKYIVIMNPDTLAFKDTFRKLFGYLEQNPEVGVAGPMQFNPDQSVQDSCYRRYGLLTPIS